MRTLLTVRVLMCPPPPNTIAITTFSVPHPDIDPVSVMPDQTQVVMLGDKVEWQCKTKASASHTVHWKKVRSVASSFPHVRSWKNGVLPRTGNCALLAICLQSFFL